MSKDKDKDRDNLIERIEKLEEETDDLTFEWANLISKYEDRFGPIEDAK